MRVAVDASSCFNRRGFGRFARELLTALVARRDGIEYTLLVDREPEPGELPDLLHALPRVNARPRRTVTASAVAGDRRSVGDLFAFTLAARRARCDLVFVPAVYSAFPLWPGTRAVVCFHDAIAETFPRLVFPDWKSKLAWNAKSRLAALQATRLMTVSAASRRDLARHFGVPPDRFDLVTEGADGRFRPLADRAELARELTRLCIPQERPWFLYVGGISPHKNLATLLEAFARLPPDAAGTGAALVLVGDLKADGFLANAEELARRIEGDARLKQRCHFTGFVNDDDLVWLYNGAHALVLPSLLEGFGLPALEAMSCGTPVLASDSGSLPEVVGEGGLYYSPTDFAGMARALERALVEPGLRAALAAKAQVQATKFSWSMGAELAVASFARALDQPAPRAGKDSEAAVVAGMPLHRTSL